MPGKRKTFVVFWLCAFFVLVWVFGFFFFKNRKMYQVNTLDWPGGKQGTTESKLPGLYQESGGA